MCGFTGQQRRWLRRCNRKAADCILIKRLAAPRPQSDGQERPRGRAVDHVRYGSQPVNDDEKVLNSGGFFRIAKAIG